MYDLITNKISSVTIDGTDYLTDNFSNEGKLRLMNVNFVNDQISQLESELAVCTTARNGYLKLLNLELSAAKKSEA